MPAGDLGVDDRSTGLRGLPPHQARSAHEEHSGHLRHRAQRHDRSRQGDRGRRRRLPHEAAQPSRARRARAQPAQAQGGDGLARGHAAQAARSREDARRSDEDDRARSQDAAHVGARDDGDADRRRLRRAATTEQRKMLTDAEGKAEDLLALIGDLLEVVAHRGGDDDARPPADRARRRCSTRSCTSGRSASSRRARPRSIDVADDAPVFEADKALLKRVLGNLVSERAHALGERGHAASVARAATATAFSSRSPTTARAFRRSITK